MKINKLTKKANNKYEVIIDNKKHIIFGDVLLDMNIFKPCDIDKGTYEAFLDRNDYYTYYNKIIKYIMVKMRSEKEIKEKLFKLGANNKLSNEIIKKIKDNNLINDDKYIKAYINDQINLTLNGPNKIRYDLKKLGFKEDIINKYEINIEEERINKIINKKIKSNHNYSKKKLLLKIKGDLNILGYDEKDYNHLLNNVIFDDEDIYKKDYLKLFKKYHNKYDNEKLDYVIKQKLYILGYDLDNYEHIKNSIN